MPRRKKSSRETPAAKPPIRFATQRTVAGLLLALTVIGAGLRLMQYGADAALSLDEIAVARNVLERGWQNLLSAPLAYDQTAPRGFLLAEKLAAGIFGDSDYALRLFSLLCSLTALIGFRCAAGENSRGRRRGDRAGAVCRSRCPAGALWRDRNAAGLPDGEHQAGAVAPAGEEDAGRLRRCLYGASPAVTF